MYHPKDAVFFCCQLPQSHPNFVLWIYLGPSNKPSIPCKQSLVVRWYIYISWYIPLYVLQTNPNLCEKVGFFCGSNRCLDFSASCRGGEWSWTGARWGQGPQCCDSLVGRKCGVHAWEVVCNRGKVLRYIHIYVYYIYIYTIYIYIYTIYIHYIYYIYIHYHMYICVVYII